MVGRGRDPKSLMEWMKGCQELCLSLAVEACVCPPVLSRSPFSGSPALPFIGQGGAGFTDKRKEEREKDRTRRLSDTHSQVVSNLLTSLQPFHQRLGTSPSLDRLYPLLQTVHDANNTSSNKLDVGTFGLNQYKSCVL